MDETFVFDLVGEIYEAAMKPERWQTVTAALKEETRSVGAHLGIGHPDHVINLLGFAYDYASPEDLLRTMQGVGREDLHFARQHLTEEGVAMLGHDFVRTDEHLASRFYQEAGRRYGLCHLAGAILFRQPEMIAPLTLWRAENQDKFSEEHRKILNLLTPHFRRSLVLADNLQRKDQAFDLLKNSLDALAVRIIFINDGSRILFLNQAAERLLAEDTHLRRAEARLAASDPANAGALASFIAKLFDAGASRAVDPGLALRLGGRDGTPLQLVGVTRVGDESGLRSASVKPTIAMLVIADPGAGADTARDMISALFGLTNAEAELADALNNGVSLPAYCRKKAISPNTAKTHLKRVFSKTHTHSQIELIRLFGSLSLLSQGGDSFAGGGAP